MKLYEVLDKLIGVEGGYVNNPKDRGGETNWGITVAVARAFGYAGDMKLLPKGTARDIYAQRYWYQPRFDLIDKLSPKLAEEMLDTGVNMGPSVPSKDLQRCLNVLNREGQMYQDIAVDGNLGPMTAAALASFLKVRGQSGETVLLRMLNSLQCARYIEIAETKGSQEEFIFGWVLNRVEV